jgi:hypothetical protein
MKQPNRSIVIQHNNGQPDVELQLGKAVNVLNSGDKEFIYLEKMDDGKWRLTFSSMFENFSSIEQLKIVRESV